MSEYEILQIKCKALELENMAVKDELEVLKRNYVQLEERIAQIEHDDKTIQTVVDLTYEEDDDMTVQLMIENKVLECEKKRAEDDARFWKEKVRELESQVVSLKSEKAAIGLRGDQSVQNGESARSPSQDKNEVSVVNPLRNEKAVDGDETFCPSLLAAASQILGTPVGDTHYKHVWHINGDKSDTNLENSSCRSRVRKKLAYGDEGTPNKSIAPSTPAGLRQKEVTIHISESDDELAVGIEKDSKSEDCLIRTNAFKTEEEDSVACKWKFSSSATPKRRRVSNVVTTDSDTDDENDKVPICKLKRMRLEELVHDPATLHSNSCSTGAGNVTGSVTPLRCRRLATLSQREEGKGVEKSFSRNRKTVKTKYEAGIPTTDEVDDDETEEVESENEGESLGGFIVDSPSDDNDLPENSGETTDESEFVSEDNMEFGEIISTIKRSRDDKLNWEFEADMLAALGKNAELCLKAVCALYRRQTADEKSVKGTLHSNGRGFSQFDALRGTILAEFLLDGDPEGELKKTVDELKAYDRNAISLCRTFANRYSKQLFEIYKNKEDPYFHPF